MRIKDAQAEKIFVRLTAWKDGRGYHLPDEEQEHRSRAHPHQPAEQIIRNQRPSSTGRSAESQVVRPARDLRRLRDLVRSLPHRSEGRDLAHKHRRIPPTIERSP